MPRRRGGSHWGAWGVANSSRAIPGSPLNYYDILDSIKSPPGLNSSFTETGADVTDCSIDDQVLLGTIRGSIVGIQYYHGEVNRQEMVALVRQPNNRYDPNAIKVENVWGEQVGHIKRELAKPMASICDSKLARVEGVVPYGDQNSFRIPVDISFWGPAENCDAVKAKLSRHGFYLKCSPGGQIYGGSGTANAAPSYTPKSVLGASVKLSQAEMKNQLDKLFEDIRSGDKTSFKEPSLTVMSPLYPHQKQALHWMTLRENSDSLPPFWETRGANYFNTLTNFTSTKRPNGVHGGILADDMGLGKTLTVISLILTNSLDGLPLFEVEAKGASELTTSQSLEQAKASLSSLPSMPVFEAKGASEPTTSQSLGQAKSSLPSLPSMPVFEVTVPASSETASEPMVVQQPLTDSQEGALNSILEQVQSVDGVNTTGAGGNEEVVMILIEDDISSGGTVNNKPEVVTLDDSVVLIEDDNKTPLKTQNGEGTDVAKETKSKRPRRTTKKPITYIIPDDDDENWTPEKKKAKPAKKRANKTKPKTTKKTEKPVEIDPNRPRFKRRFHNGRPAATLIVCPVSVLGNWMDQIEEHVQPGTDLKVHLYHGQSRASSAKKLASEDIVITTYNTLGHEFKTKGGKSTLHSIQWLRLVLDEAHIIRNPSAMQTKAVLELNAQRHWALSGTPIQNNIKDLWSLMAFLRLEPFKSNHQWWQRIIERPIRQGDQDALRRVQKLMEVLALRRTKTQKVDGKLLVELPPKNVVLQYVELSEDERTMYNSMAKDGKLSVNKYFATGKPLDHYGDILAILLRLRQLCCHPGLCAKAATKLAADAASPEEKKRLVAALLAVLSQGSDEECCVCLDSLQQPVITQCAHVFCFQCIMEVITQNKANATCPLCRGDINETGLVHVPPEESTDGQEDTAGEWHSSAKVDALMQCLIQERDRDPSTKSLVVSQFTSFLTMLQRPLREKGFNFVRLDGSMTAVRRAEAVRQFSSLDAGSPTVFLLSLKAGGVGLNLTAANKVFLMDPAWNPAVEDQCFDRCHRLGQTKEVTVTKFVIKDSVEERMLELQEKKRVLMAEAFGVKAKAEERQRARINDVKILFGM